VRISRKGLFYAGVAAGDIAMAVGTRSTFIPALDTYSGDSIVYPWLWRNAAGSFLGSYSCCIVAWGVAISHVDITFFQRISFLVSRSVFKGRCQNSASQLRHKEIVLGVIACDRQPHI
jgi:hypothetical protein